MAIELFALCCGYYLDAQDKVGLALSVSADTLGRDLGAVSLCRCSSDHRSPGYAGALPAELRLLIAQLLLPYGGAILARAAQIMPRLAVSLRHRRTLVLNVRARFDPEARVLLDTSGALSGAAWGPGSRINTDRDYARWSTGTPDTLLLPLPREEEFFAAELRVPELFDPLRHHALLELFAGYRPGESTRP